MQLEQDFLRHHQPCRVGGGSDVEGGRAGDVEVENHRVAAELPGITGFTRGAPTPYTSVMFARCLPCIWRRLFLHPNLTKLIPYRNDGHVDLGPEVDFSYTQTY